MLLGSPMLEAIPGHAPETHIAMTELYEYGMQLGDPSFSLPHLVVIFLPFSTANETCAENCCPDITASLVPSLSAIQDAEGHSSVGHR